MPIPLFLASASPRRLTLLIDLGCDARAHPTGIPEDVLPGETVEAHVLRLAEKKARSTASELGPGEEGLVLGADTVVVLDGSILGKPKDLDDARSMLLRLAGRSHEVLTGVFLLRRSDGRSARRALCTRVRFRDYDEATVTWYLGTREPMDKAGAYGIQGLGALLCEGIEGSWSNVVGLPLERLPDLCRELGIDVRDLFRGSA
jgi:septum formation protein